MNGKWEKIEAPHDPEAGSGIPLWRQKVGDMGWLVISGTGSLVYIPEKTQFTKWHPKVIGDEAATTNQETVLPLSLQSFDNQVI